MPLSSYAPSPKDTPLLRLAPAGKPVMVIDNVSDVSISFNMLSIDSRTVCPTSPDASPAATFGVSATAFTTTANVVVAVLVAPVEDSRDVAEIVRSKSTSESAGGVIVKPLNCSGVSVQEPSLLGSPADSSAPTGTLEMVTLRVSEPSVSVSAASMLSAIAASSSPSAADTLNSGVSAVSSPSVVNVCVTDALSPSFSVAVAVTSKSKSGSTPSGTLMVKPSNCSVVSVQVPSLLSVPADNDTPSGNPDTLIDKDSEPSTSFKLDEISSGNVVIPSTPASLLR